MACYMKKEPIPNAFTMFIGKSIISDDTSLDVQGLELSVVKLGQRI